jgi:hypothetical protein
LRQKSLRQLADAGFLFFRFCAVPIQAGSAQSILA